MYSKQMEYGGLYVFLPFSFTFMLAHRRECEHRGGHTDDLVDILGSPVFSENTAKISLFNYESSIVSDMSVLFYLTSYLRN